ncbi:MAG: hypothetical protein JNL34_13270 [Anaerolineae bacterium]|nr:hypothetical protein [Anaerolineae bacterium]
MRNRQWDLAFISLSVILVPLPYLLYLLGMHVFNFEYGSANDDGMRNGINAFVAIAVGGPHMMSTFMRTSMDSDFRSRYPMLIRSSIIIPIVVVALAFLNLTLLLTIFFAWASLHVLHQITYIVELYNHKERTFVRPRLRFTRGGDLIDFAVIMTCLFPFAALKISQGAFSVGQNDLTENIPEFFQQSWFFYAMTAIFTTAAVLWIIKTVRQARAGNPNWPRTIFIVLTVTIAFIIPSLPNLDTAFQGLNVWHSFQYLALTFFIIEIRRRNGQLSNSAPLVNQFGKKGSRGLFILSSMLLVGSILVFLGVYIIAPIIEPGINGEKHFSVAYYTAILSFLWIHYYHDHFLFFNFEALDSFSSPAPAK